MLFQESSEKQSHKKLYIVYTYGSNAIGHFYSLCQDTPVV